MRPIQTKPAHATANDLSSRNTAQHKDQAVSATGSDDSLAGPSMPTIEYDKQEELGGPCTDVIQAVSEQIKKVPLMHGIPCPICKRVVVARRIVKHVEVHRKCKICGFIAINNWRLKIHMFRHTNEKPFNCPKCGRPFKNKVHLRNHLRNFHSAVERGLPCPHCGKARRRVDSHIQRQHPETLPGYQKREYECYVCHKICISEPVLQSHMNGSHIRRRKVLCPQCGKTFASNCAFKRHLMKEDHKVNGESLKPFICKYCQKAFATKKPMEDHVNIHTGKIITLKFMTSYSDMIQ